MVLFKCLACSYLYPSYIDQAPLNQNNKWVKSYELETFFPEKVEGGKYPFKQCDWWSYTVITDQSLTV